MVSDTVPKRLAAVCSCCGCLRYAFTVMEIREALKEQYHAVFAMLEECIETCPNDLWTTPNPMVDDGDRTIYRSFWRISFHAIFFTHLYIGQRVEDFQPPPDDLEVRKRSDFAQIWGPPWEVEPYELREETEAPSKEGILAYLRYVDGLVDPIFDRLDLNSSESGIPWYENFPKLNHEILTLRHLQGHAGQLSELLFARGLSTDWVSRPKTPA